jgi:hypothetical protein
MMNSYNMFLPAASAMAAQINRLGEESPRRTRIHEMSHRTRAKKAAYRRGRIHGVQKGTPLIIDRWPGAQERSRHYQSHRPDDGLGSCAVWDIHRAVGALGWLSDESCKGPMTQDATRNQHDQHDPERRRQVSEAARETAERDRSVAEEKRAASERARTTAEKERTAAEAARNTALTTLRVTAEGLTAALEHMRGVEKMRRTHRALPNPDEPDTN